jgi:hypothetical protein
MTRSAKYPPFKSISLISLKHFEKYGEEYSF